MKTKFIARLLLTSFTTVALGQASPSAEKPGDLLRPILPNIGDPWEPSSKNDQMQAQPSSHLMKRVYTHNGHTIEAEARILRDRDLDSARGMLEAYAKGLAQVPGHAVPMEGGGRMSLLSYTKQWVVVSFQNNPKERVQVSGVHKTQPLSFVATAPQQEVAVLKQALEQSLGVRLDAKTSVETPFFTVLNDAEPPIYVFVDKRDAKPPPAALAYVQLIRALLKRDAEAIREQSHPDLFKRLQSKEGVSNEMLEEAADVFKDLIRIEIRDIRVDPDANEAHMTVHLIKDSPTSNDMRPVVVQVDGKWLVRHVND